MQGLARLSLALLVTGLLVTSAFGGDHATVLRVVDGDTLELSLAGKTEKVRLIGVDTPEVHASEKLHRDAARTQQDVATIRALGRQASDFTKHLVHVGERVRLEFDQQPRDKYQRLLAFVWLPDGRMLNETIICEGYSPAFTRYPFRQDYMDRFRACERSARQGNKGLWREERVATTVAPSARSSQTRGEIHGNRRSKIYHLPSCPNYSRLKPENVVPFASEAEAVQDGYRRAKNCPEP
jgi:micrococcal nuclease